VVCRDEMGPEAATSWPGQRVLRTAPSEQPRRPAGRARQEIDSGRRESGYLFGAFQPATGAAFTAPYPRRPAVNWADFLERVDGGIDPSVERVEGVRDTLSAHRATDVLLVALAHPRGEFVFPPQYAAYLNLIEPWWKILRSLALTGRRFANWVEISQAVEAATAYWNAHAHPFVWGHRRRHRPRRQPGIALTPAVA
jgi:DDE superfamily endonuclease